ncbi:tricarballylate utilization 4Fe-4S protein TcuB [Magnetospirillum molischianum]|uniref:Putative citrate utilization protein B (CitB) putative membrane protein n=1 Tax=Magnetospirillum molischianum DSM 120 TaxID=1150626 RepID=H8FQ74_MAGML|nr:tricarballylate utilization 4Fe-4S protein TcuB [Magnetospirillum molischianum]CCG40512.1 putative citrate utilization protein B (citB); putative membrane protein [Magnetospirillum molischianum DSM 120]
MRLDDPHEEARRVLRLCNVCNYCNGYCEMFRAAERHRTFSDGELATLAHLCHNCRNCWQACQYAPPHPFAVNVPLVLAELRLLSQAELAWPRPLGHLGLLSLVVTLLPPLLVLLLVPIEVLFAAHAGPGAFYRVIPWSVMSLAAALPLGWSALALAVGLVRFWRAGGNSTGAEMRAAAPEAIRDAILLRNLDGGGAGCDDGNGPLSFRRKYAHHLVFAGFLLCLASTSVATVYHHLLGLEAPYPMLSLPVVLGSLGGVGLIAGSLGLLALKRGADPAPIAPAAQESGQLLLLQLLAMAASGLLLLALRDGPAMGILLALHLGTVLSFFVALPHGKFAHAPYRAAALLRAALERRNNER